MSAVRRNVAASVRPMHETDIAQVMEVERVNYPYPWTEGIMRDCLRVGYSCWVMETDGVLAAYAVLSAAAGEAHVLNISVAPGRQGLGLGRQLMEHLLQAAHGHGADTVFLEVRPSNKVAVHLYESMGFNQVGVRNGYYPSEVGREDAIIMARVLSDISS